MRCCCSSVNNGFGSFCQANRMETTILFIVGIEVYCRSSFCTWICLEGGPGSKAKPAGIDIIGKSSDSSIILLYCPIVVVTCYLNAVFGAFQLGLQTTEGIIGAQVRI